MSVRFGGTLNTYETLLFLEDRLGLGLFVLDLSNGTLRWSDGMYALFGLKAPNTEPTLALALSMIHPDDRTLPGWWTEAGRQARILDQDFRILLKDGRIRHLTSHSRLLSTDGEAQQLLVGACFDSTGPYEMRGLLQLSERRFKALAAAGGGFVWLSSGDGTLIHWVSRSTELTPDLSLLGWFGRIHTDDRAKVTAAWKTAVEHKTSFSVDHRLSADNGAYRWHHSRAAPILDSFGSLMEWVGITLDIHDLTVGIPTPAAHLTGMQIRGARGILNLSVRELAEAAHISPATLRRLEEFDGPATGDHEALESLRGTMEQSGVEFFRTITGQPAIRTRSERD